MKRVPVGLLLQKLEERISVQYEGGVRAKIKAVVVELEGPTIPRHVVVLKPSFDRKEQNEQQSSEVTG